MTVPDGNNVSEQGLRERKKAQTRQALSQIALRLFSERGFDAVTIADIAEEAQVSTKTVFNYFPVKEDLVLSGQAEREEAMVQALRTRPAGQSILTSVRRHTLETAEQMRAVPAERRAAFRQVVQGTPSVGARWRESLRVHEEALARVLAEETPAGGDELAPFLAASLLGVLRRLAFCDVFGWPDGKRRSPERAAEEIERAFDLLEGGLAPFKSRKR